MELKDAIRNRHSVRKYKDQPIDEATADALKKTIERCNEESGLNIQLVLDEPKAFANKLVTYGQFSGVRNYLVMAGPKGTEWEEKIGYYGEKIVIFAQTIDLNTCWVALLAPTAVNQQKFKFILHPDNRVEAKAFSSLWGYTHVDLGIAKYNFELAAGKENFEWV